PAGRRRRGGGRRALRGAGRAGPRRRAALFAEAIGLWRGDAFDGFADERFAQAAAARLEEQRLLVWEEYAETRLELGEHDLLAGELADLARRHPLRERLRAGPLPALYGPAPASEAPARFPATPTPPHHALGP